MLKINADTIKKAFEIEIEKFDGPKEVGSCSCRDPTRMFWFTPEDIKEES